MQHANLCHLDLETTGLYPRIHGISQIGYILERVEVGQATGEVLLEKSIKVAPFPGDELNPKALEITGYTIESVKEGAEPGDACMELITDIKSTFGGELANLVGYNVKFDEDFLRAFFKKCSAGYFSRVFRIPSIDVMSIVANHVRFQRDVIDAFIKEKGGRSKFTLGLIAEALGIEPEGDLHDALTDIRVTRQIYNMCCEETVWE